LPGVNPLIVKLVKVGILLPSYIKYSPPVVTLLWYNLYPRTGEPPLLDKLHITVIECFDELTFVGPVRIDGVEARMNVFLTEKAP